MRLLGLTFLAWAAQSTAPNPHWPVFCSAFSLDFFPELASPCIPFGLSALLDFLRLVPSSLLLLPATRFCPSIWMSTAAGHDDDILELTCNLGALAITIRGPQEQASDLLQYITHRGSSSAASSQGSVASYSVVGTGPTRTTSAPLQLGHPTRDQIAAGFDPCPQVWIESARVLSGPHSSEFRAKRAWVAGQWARAVLQGRVSTPNKTPGIDLKTRFYAVVSCSGLDPPTIFNSSASYWRAVGGDLSRSDSISQGFPSQTEARIYFAGAGIVNFEIKP